MLEDFTGMKTAAVHFETFPRPISLCLVFVLVTSALYIPPVPVEASDCSVIQAEIGKVKRKLRKAKKIKKVSKKRRVSKKAKKKLRKLKVQLAGCGIVVAPPAAPPFLEMVTIGNAGNRADAGNTSDPNVYGAVAYAFQIGKYEVTLEQYTAFLNAVAATDTYALYESEMTNDLHIAGILRSGSSGSFTYSVIGSGERPVTYVDWFDAARFCNWLHNGRPTGAQGASTTETGAYALNGATSGVGFTREVTANYWIPSEDEWYKAAFHDPTGPGDEYYAYPTMSDTPPDNQIGALPLMNQANVYTTVYSVTQLSSRSSTQNYLTDRGAFEGSPSFYGTFDQGGNVWEWTDGLVGGTMRALRGSSWDNNTSQMQSSFRSTYGLERADTVGFRVASPAP